MISVTVNGTGHRFEHALNVSELLAQLALTGRKIAVEQNGEIVPRSLHGSTAVRDGDQFEIVVAVGGG